MIRITGGIYRGRRIQSPPGGLGETLRPTTGRVRESLFACLGDRLAGARFLDLFAGTGLMGLEALSRGAAFVLAVERNRAHGRLIRENYALLNIPENQYRLRCQDVGALVSMPCEETDGPFDVVYLDPPYGNDDLPQWIDRLYRQGWLTSDGIAVVEHAARDPHLPGAERRVYGDTALSFIRI